MLPASLTAELDITQEEMNSFADDIFSVCPGCKRVKLATPAVRSAIMHIFYTSAAVGHELENVWVRMNHLQQAMTRIEERFGGDKTPPEPGSPKDNAMEVINVSLDTLAYILSALDAYGFWSQAETQHHFLVFRHQLDNILGIIAGIIKATAPLLEAEGPLLKAEDCHEGMGLPTDPSSSPQSSHAGEGVGDKELSGSPAHTLEYGHSPPTNISQAQEGPENVHSSSSSGQESHDEAWTFRMQRLF